METPAFLLDAYSSPAGIVMWLILDDGRRVSVAVPYRPYVYFKRTDNFAEIMGLFGKRFGGLVDIAHCEKQDVFFNAVPVLKVTSGNPAVYNSVLKFIRESGISARADFFNMDMPAEEMFLQDSGLFPFCRCALDGKSARVTPAGKPRELFYDIPDIVIMKISPEGPGGREAHDLDPAHMFYPPALKVSFYIKNTINRRVDGKGQFISDENNMELFSGTISDENMDYFEGIFRKYDPDAIISSYGDSYILRRLIGERGALRYLNRESAAKPPTPRSAASRPGSGRTYFSYGRTLYKYSSVILKGRLHIDGRNSFFYGEAGLDGIIELSRLSAIPVQRLSRVSPGTVVTAIETNYAISRDILVPYLKTMPEDFKTLSSLIKIDKGGLTYRPLTGLHENVAECDFVSMYPSIIVNYNLSYETINCPHRECNTRLPFTGYRVCSKNTGIVPSAIKMLIERRNSYKGLEDPSGVLGKRRTALKWLLVVCFGYLGYKNAKFGRIESHEATTAIGRELLLTAKEVAEDEGFNLLHGLTDCVWIAKKGAGTADYKAAVGRINDIIRDRFKGINRGKNAVGFEIALEGIYKWIAFLPSKESGVGVSNRFYGLFDGKGNDFKIRGIELRRRDTPLLVKRFQSEALEILSKAPDVRGFGLLLPAVDALLKDYIDAVNCGRYHAWELVVRKSISVDPLAYSKRTDTAEAAQTLIAEGKAVKQGSHVDMVYVDAPPVKAMPYALFMHSPAPVDARKYIKMLKSAAQAFFIF